MFVGRLSTAVGCVLLPLVLGCNAAFVRVKNDGPADFDQVVVTFTDSGRVEFGPLKSGECSGYHLIRTWRIYAQIEVSSGGERFVRGYDCPVGIPNLGWGWHTYRLTPDGNDVRFSYESRLIP